MRQHRRSAQGLIGRYAAAKATGVAMNPLIAIDLAGGLACDTALVMQLCQLYGLPMAPTSARRLLRSVTAQNALLGGVQLGLSALKQLLLLELFLLLLVIECELLRAITAVTAAADDAAVY